MILPDGYTVKKRNGYYAVYRNKIFLFSADTIEELVEELKEYIDSPQWCGLLYYKINYNLKEDNLWEVHSLPLVPKFWVI